MNNSLMIVGLGGSMAKVSRSRAALTTALEGAASAGAQTQLLDLRELALSMYNPDDDVPTEAATRLIESCYTANGMLQGTISGGLKNALDWLHLLRDRDPPFLHDKVIGLISAAAHRRQFPYGFANAVSEDEAKQLLREGRRSRTGSAALPGGRGQPESVDRGEGRHQESRARPHAFTCW